MQGGRTLRSVLTARVAGPERQRLRAYTRSVANIAMGLGALVAGVAIQVDTRAAYLAVIVGNAISFIVSAGIVARLPGYPPIPAPAGGSRLPVLRNLPYMTITVLNLVMTFQYGVIAIALPLWVVQETQAPRATVAAVFLISAALVALLQIRVGQGVEDVAGAARMMRRAGVVFLLSCSAFALTGELSALWATLALLAITALHTVGELWHAAAVFELSYQLAPDHAQGEYQGVFALGVGASDALAPALITFLCLVQAPQGWFALGALLALTGLLVPPVARWAGRHLAAGQPGQLAPSVSG
jgi:MFS family permease